MQIYVMKNPNGGYNGYAAVPKGHPLWGTYYRNIMRWPGIPDLTFSRPAHCIEHEGFTETFDEEAWVFGFDSIPDEEECQAFAVALAVALARDRNPNTDA